MKALQTGGASKSMRWVMVSYGDCVDYGRFPFFDELDLFVAERDVDDDLSIAISRHSAALHASQSSSEFKCFDFAGEWLVFVVNEVKDLKETFFNEGRGLGGDTRTN